MGVAWVGCAAPSKDHRSRPSDVHCALQVAAKELAGCRAWPACIAASAVTPATTTGSTLVSGFVESLPTQRCEVISSGHGWRFFAGRKTAASSADCVGVSATVRPTTTSSSRDRALR